MGDHFGGGDEDNFLPDSVYTPDNEHPDTSSISNDDLACLSDGSNLSQTNLNESAGVDEFPQFFETESISSNGEDEESIAEQQFPYEECQGNGTATVPVLISRHPDSPNFASLIVLFCYQNSKERF